MVLCRFKQAHELSFFFNFWKGIIQKGRMRVKKATCKRQQSNLNNLCSFNYRYILVYVIQHFHLKELSTGKWVVCVFVLGVIVAVSFSMN